MQHQQREKTKRLKKAFSLVEVLVAVSLIATVIASVLQMQQNNLFFLEKFKTSSTNNTYISLGVEKIDTKELRNKNIIVGDKINLGDDDIRRELKAIKLKVKDTQLKDKELPENDYVKTIQIYESAYSLENMTKKFYTFKLQ